MAIMHGDTLPNIVFDLTLKRIKRIRGDQQVPNYHNTPIFSSIHRSMTPPDYIVNPLPEGIGLFLAWQGHTSARTWSRSTPQHGPTHTCMQLDQRVFGVNARA